MPSPALVRAHLSELIGLTTLAVADLATLWRSYDLNDAAASERSLKGDLRGLVAEYGPIAGAIGVDFYAEARDEAKVAGRFVPRIISATDPTSVDKLAGWAVKPLYSGAPDATAALARTSGGLQRLVANVDRETVAGNVGRDRKATRWMRQASSTCCAFCSVMATRSDLGSHYHRNCRCTVVPAFNDSDIPEHYDTFRAEYDAAVEQARAAGEKLRIPNKNSREDTILWRIRQNTGRA